jgi:Ca-activated chloride channel family protein
MSFNSPVWLLALVVIPAALLAYRWARRRPSRYAVRFTAVSTLSLAAAAVPDRRRHIPAALALTAAAALIVALAKPHTTVRVPVQEASVMLVTDHSGSMQASDVLPTRLAAADRAANSFIDQLPSAVRVGAVAFSSSPDGVQAPSTDHQAARQVIDNQVANGATATGDALALALQLLHQGAKKLPPSAIVLLSDGAANAGQDPVSVARQAGAEKVPIYTVALGTPGATITNPADPLGGAVDVSPDPQLMAEIAQVSGGRAFNAQDAGSLGSIYTNLGSQLGTRTVSHEVTASFAVAGMVLLLLAGMSSLRWVGRLP